MKLGKIIVSAMVPALILVAPVQRGATQNLNQKYGPSWDCSYITYAQQFVGEILACKKCEDAGQDFYRTSDSSGYCVPRGEDRSAYSPADENTALETDDPVESNLPPVIPITPKSGISSRDYFGHPFDTESTKSSEEAMAAARADAESEREAVAFLAQADKAFESKAWVKAAMMYRLAAITTQRIIPMTENQRERILHAENMHDMSECHDIIEDIKEFPYLHADVMNEVQKCDKFDFARRFLEKR